MSDGYTVEGVDALNRRLDKFFDTLPRDLSAVVQREAQLFNAALIDRITNNIRPHMAYRGKKAGKRGKRVRIRRMVTDLVDTGFLRASFNVIVINPLEAEIVTNTAYAPVLEYGSRDGKRKGFFFVRATLNARKDNYLKAVQEAYNRNVR